MSDNPFAITGHTIVANSGGKTSGYNLWRHLQANGGTLTDKGACLFTNTGHENSKTLEFLAEQSRRWQVTILMAEFCRIPATADELEAKRVKWEVACDRHHSLRKHPVSFFKKKVRARKTAQHLLFDAAPTPSHLKREAVRKAYKYAESCYESWKKAELIGTDTFRFVTPETADTSGRPFQELLEGLEKFRRDVKGEPGALPNGVQRICTGHLKVRTASRVASSIWPIKRNNYECRLGLRFDEEQRVKAAHEWGNDGGRGVFPLYEAGVTKEDVAKFWDGQPFKLTLKSHEGNCDLCYMKRRAALVDLIRRGYAPTDWWEGWEKRTGQTFKQNRSYRGLNIAARVELDLIPPDDFDNAITCEGGYCTD